MRRLVLALLLPAAAMAQRSPRSAADWLDDCRDGRWSGDGDQACDVRETTIPVRSGALRVDGRENGGVAVYGWDRNEIKVVAKLQARARSKRDAEDLLKEIEIRTSGDIRADGPNTGRRESWSVSYDVYVPRRTDLDLATHNGGVHIADVDGTIRFDAVNGGVSLDGLAGDVRGATENGGVRVSLVGDRWRGAGLDVRTQNGGVTVSVPDRYNAELETGTVNGHMSIDFPITVSGRLYRDVSTRLGTGGAPVRVRTTNGGVNIRRI